MLNVNQTLLKISYAKCESNLVKKYHMLNVNQTLLKIPYVKCESNLVKNTIC